MKLKHKILQILIIILLISACMFFVRFYLKNQLSEYDKLVLFRTKFDFDTNLTPRNICSTKPLFALFLVTSDPSHFSIRKAIRDTWGSNLNEFNSKLVFVLGTTSNHETMKQIKREHLNYSDLIQIDFIDSYFNLTIKSVMGIKWVIDNCNETIRYLIKTDDDNYINIKFLISQLHIYLNPLLLMGQVYDKATVIRDKSHKWYCPREMYDLETYPKYTSGYCYVITLKAAKLLYKNFDKYSYLHLEDVFVTGLAAKRTPIMHKHSDRFLKYPVSFKTFLTESILVSHGFDEYNLRKMHSYFNQISNLKYDQLE